MIWITDRSGSAARVVTTQPTVKRMIKIVFCTRKQCERPRPGSSVQFATPHAALDFPVSIRYSMGTILAPTSTKRKNKQDREETLELPLAFLSSPPTMRRQSLPAELAAFREFGQPTRKLATAFGGPDGQTREIPAFINEFWTARQRQASSLQEVSYRACFKPQLHRFFIE